MPAEAPDPTVIRSIAVTTADVVAALELNRTSDETAVLRVTPPFHGRMRARLHLSSRDGTAGGDRAGSEDTQGNDPRPLQVDPGRLVEDPPAYPRPADTEARLRADPEETYTVERHHEYHATAVEQWRETVPGCIRERATIETPAGPHEVTVTTLDGELM